MKPNGVMTPAAYAARVEEIEFRKALHHADPYTRRRMIEAARAERERAQRIQRRAAKNRGM